MGKRIDDLPLDDRPLKDPAPDPRDTTWFRFIQSVPICATARHSGEHRFEHIFVQPFADPLAHARVHR